MKSLKKIPIIFVFLSLICFFAIAKQEKVLQIYRNGEIIQEYSVNDIDYIEVNDFIAAPSDVNASVANDKITIKWNAVEGATYNIYRSADNVNFTMLAQGLTATSYTDNSPLKGSNYYKIKAIIAGKESGYTTTAAATLTDSDMESGVYLGIIGFNSALYEHPIMRLEESSVAGYYDFVDKLQAKDMTLLYYSVEKALDKMQTATFPSDLSQVALVTFTDGLDRGSHGKTDAYLDSEDGDLDYRNDLNKRITTQTIAGKKITAYSIGIKGDDVRDYAKFKDNINKLASSPANAYEVSNMAEVNAKFKEIAETLTTSTNIQSFTTKIPPEANGSIIRITFDNTKTNADNSKVWIQGTLNLRTKTLEDIKYKGLEFVNPVTSVVGVEDEEGFYNYTFEGIVTDNNLIFTPEATMEHIYIKSTNSWQPNTEFGRDGNFVPKIDRSSAAIMLVLDCTSSLGDMFATSKNNAKNFIKTLYDAYGNEPYTPETPPSYGDTQTFTVNGVSFNMIQVNSGSYMMGSNDGDSSEMPVHNEDISSFKIGETEVTQALWKAVLGSNPSYFTGNDERPVENINWNDCQTFIHKLNDFTGRQFRLPTEAEWEYAARGGDRSKNYTYSGSNNINDVAWYADNSDWQTHPVRQKLPNELGIYDMSGNVWEWTSDLWSDNYNSIRNGGDGGSKRVNRGGSYSHSDNRCRVEHRCGDTSGEANNRLGFRLAL